MALLPFRKPDYRRHRVLGWNRDAHVHIGPASGDPRQSGTPFAEPARGKSDPIAYELGRRWLSAVAWVRILRGTCSPILNGIGFDKFQTLHPLLVGSSSHLERILLPERSNLFESHWSNQWLTY